MGKNDFLTPKIANRIKAKGLQKLKWYCQMCQKQCRDENGFKCHLTSDSHRRQMELFGQNPGRIIEGYSEEFHSCFMEHMRRAHPHIRIEAHKVYNEYIQDKQHIHMNSTKWLTLTEYVKYLGKEGFCKVEDTPKGWFIQLIHRDPEQEKLDLERSIRKRKDLDEALRQQREIDAQIARARASGADAVDHAGHEQGHISHSELERRVEDGNTIQVVFEKPPGHHAAESIQKDTRASRPGLFGVNSGTVPSSSTVATDANRAQISASMLSSKRKSKWNTIERSSQADHPDDDNKCVKSYYVDELLDEVKQKKQRDAAGKSTDTCSPLSGSWIRRGLIVKVMAQQLTGYFKRKGEIISIEDEYVANVEMLESGDVVRIDQAHLETVIPKAGGRVRIVMGMGSGKSGQVVEVHREDFQVEIELDNGDRIFKEYEHVCKVSGN